MEYSRHPVFKAIQKFLNAQEIQLESERILVGLSGGPDSVCLVYCLYQMGYKLHVAHVNYNLRGKESQADAQFCQNLCDQLDIPISILILDKNEAKLLQSGSMQEKARNIRYSWFEKLMLQKSCKYLCTAHHLDDHIETFFINLLRGTGLRGMLGIQSAHKRVIRPLLDIQKTEILDYLNSFKIDFREDQTNQENKYFRNKIRNILLPEIVKLKPEFPIIMKDNISKLSDAYALLSIFFQQWKGKNIVFDSEIIQVKKSVVKELNTPYLVFMLLEPYHFNYEMAKQVFQSIELQPGKIFLSRTHEVLIDRSTIQIRKKGNDIVVFEEIPLALLKGMNKIKTPLGTLVINSPINEELQNPKCLIVPISSIHQNLVLRNWKPSDRFQPFGMNGKHKKVSDLLTDLKLSKFEKDNVLVLSDQENILWVIGLRKSHTIISANSEKETSISFEWNDEI